MSETPLRYLKGIGPRREILFNNIGVRSVKDLLYYFPFRYQDRRNFKRIKDLEVDEFSVIKGKIRTTNLKNFPYFLRSKKVYPSKPRRSRVKSVFEAILEDETGSVRCTWFNQLYLSKIIKVGVSLVIYGKLRVGTGGRQIIAPEYTIGQGDETLGTGKIIGVYRLPSEFTQKFMRKVIFSALKNHLPKYSDPLPYYLRRKENIPNIVKSLEEMHLPSSWEQAQIVRERFIFEELFLSQILVYLRKAKRVFQQGVKFKISKSTIEKIRKNIKFKLTESQEESLTQILGDLDKSYPMHRILQGDVGCGKTAIATFAIGICADCGFQAALMVPTEVLAFQHKETLEKSLKGLKFLSKGNSGEAIKVISSSLTKRETEDIYNGLRSGTIKVIVGTHSLIQGEVKFKKLGLVVIDEQHRFGVAQRALLPKKGKIAPHCLVMSATPIPRSLALSLYGDLDSSVINQMPEGRMVPLTRWAKEKDRPEVYDFLRKILNQGRQVYIIYPVIEESLDEDLKPLKIMYKKIVEEFPEFKAKMFHGRMKSKEKIKAIKTFKDKKVDILVSTTVVEVGLNIENATTMLVENPERFGLAQLHQLRGRIQRSKYQPYFFLLSKENLSKEASRRLEIISEEASGFKIAEEDLKLRGPGDFFGNLQHGLPDLKIANPIKDLEILKQARIFAYGVIKGDPHLSQPRHRCLREYIDTRRVFR
ncbi:MAG: ATP-dependent DNA helicase RecG [Candidatus Omnitrophica bacterium]|nr:ATP-dependent DNA helicase RecG [Candidatus Omnitrophota bacterium]